MRGMKLLKKFPVLSERFCTRSGHLFTLAPFPIEFPQIWLILTFQSRHSRQGRLSFHDTLCPGATSYQELQADVEVLTYMVDTLTNLLGWLV
ncbi:hypothetical protein HanIR_Chr08g0363531 [Helianthus annuus]|nr:hypothetical protein HanIR_Chr08g0363531 [Helianthus annuus]